MKPLLKSTSLQDARSFDTTLNLRPCIEGLSPNPGAEIIRYGRSKPNILFLGQGQGESPTPDFICKGVEKALAAGRTFYDSVLGVDDLRQEISSYYARIYGLTIPTARIFATSSGTTAMHLALTSVLDEGDEAIAITPIWKNLLSAMELAQASVREVALDNREGAWSLDLQKLFDSCTASTRAILVTSPSNPTGWVMSREEIVAVQEFARERGIWIISDEVYSRIVYDGSHAPSFLDTAEPDDKLFVVNSFSKAWAMTGWRLGWLVGPAASECHIRDIALYNNMGPPTFTQYGGIEALRHGEDFLASQIALWSGNRDYVTERFARHDRIVADRPDATFYSFFRVRGEDDCLSLCRKLIDAEGLSLAPGCAFGKVGKGYIRLCFAVSRARLEDAIGRLERVLAAS